MYDECNYIYTSKKMKYRHRLDTEPDMRIQRSCNKPNTKYICNNKIQCHSSH